MVQDWPLKNVVQICWNSPNVGPIIFSNLYLAITLAISPDPNIHRWLPSHRDILVDPPKFDLPFHLFLSGSHQYLLSLQCRGLWYAKDTEMKSKGGDIELGLADVNQVFSLVLWKVFLLDCELLRIGNMLIFVPSSSSHLAHRLASMGVCWMNKSGCRENFSFIIKHLKKYI